MTMTKLPGDVPAYMISREALERCSDEMIRLYCEGDLRLEGFEMAWDLFVRQGFVQPNGLHYMFEMPISERVRESERRKEAKV